ncbi:hypothetical protein [Duganella vulcania]|uniref:Uncharacterized protein n=1 Tax=Duganella vulcania TaxID=2692166 RepID=A0A845GID3_9BURK|nr:hypothetical protein [Duganella vulcania]MYM92429.1 hypothetical protein [Duganella vulcania]
MSSARVLLRVVLTALLCLAGIASRAGELVTVGGVQYEAVEQFKVGDGELVLHLKAKVAEPSAPKPAAGTPEAGASKSGPGDAAESADAGKDKSKSAMDLAKEKSISQLKVLDKDFASEITNQAQSTESTALTTIGVTPGDFNTPATPKDFAAAIAKGVDGSGKLKDGVAIQFSPGGLFFRSSIVGGGKFTSDPWMQAWARTSVEIASSRSDDARIGQQGAVALSVGVIDDTDPRLAWRDLSDCSDNAFDDVYPRSHINPIPAGRHRSKDEIPAAEADAAAQASAAFDKATKDCFEASKKKLGDLTLKRKFYVGYDHSWYSGDSDLAKAGTLGPRMLWASYSQGLSGANDPNASFKTLLQASATRKLHLQVKDPADDSKLTNQDRTDLMLRVRLTQNRWNAFADAGLSRVRTGPVLTDSVRRYGFGAEFKVSDTLWLVLGSVTEHGYLNGGKNTLLNTGLRFGQSDNSLIGSPFAATKN